MNEVFELIEYNNESVIIKVNVEDNLTIARNPYINSNMDYITVTRGAKHTMTVVHKDGSTASFTWEDHCGDNFCEIIKMLKNKIIDFIENDNKILLGLNSDIVDYANIYFNDCFYCWQINFKNGVQETQFYIKNANCVEDMIEFAYGYGIDDKSWIKGIAQTGITIWETNF